MDFPTAWAIARETPAEYHHNACSYNTTGGALLCDCHVLTKHPKYLADYGDDCSCGCRTEPRL
jgi:hypothetical protein